MTDQSDLTYPPPALPLEEGTRAWFDEITSRRHPATAAMVRTFAWTHLPAHLRSYSAACGRLAARMVRDLPDGPELTAGLRKLREAKDCFVIAAVEMDEATRV